MDIRNELLKLCQLQDQITHLNEAGEHGREIRKLQGQRKHQTERIARAFDDMEEALGRERKEVWEL
jgi:hypothetical protein